MTSIFYYGLGKQLHDWAIGRQESNDIRTQKHRQRFRMASAPCFFLATLVLFNSVYGLESASTAALKLFL